MKSELLVVLLENTADLIELGASKMQEFEESMRGIDGTVKKEKLDEFLKGKVEEIIKKWDIKKVPNFIEDNWLDPATIAFINNYIPKISQSVYNVALTGLDKIGDKLEDVAETIDKKSKN